MKTLKRIAAMLFIAVLLGSTVTYAAEAEYITPVENGKYNLILNSGMELTENGVPAYWSLSQGEAGIGFSTGTDAPYAGEKSARLYGTYVIAFQEIKSIEPGETYVLGAWVRRMQASSEAILQVRFDKKVNTSYQTISEQRIYINPKTDKTPIGEWGYHNYSVTVPEETVRTYVYLRLKELENQDGETGSNGEVYFDAVSLIGNPKAEYAAAMKFRTQIWKEAAEDENTLPSSPNGLYEQNKPVEGEQNLLKNSDFEDKLSGNWETAFEAYAFHAEDDAGGKCIRLAVDGAKDGTVRPYYYQETPIAGGAEYQVSYRYKVTKGEAKPWVKLQYSVAEGLDGLESAGETYVMPEEMIRDGEWHFVTMKVYPPSNASLVKVMPRLMQGNYQDEEEVYFDDVEIYMTYPPAFATLDGGWIFYYSDMQEGTLSTEIHPAFPAYAEAKVDYAILDGTTVKWESKNHISENGKTAVTFPMTVFEEYEKPYRARATIYDKDGVTVKAICTQNVYLYERPEYLDKDGIFLQNGETPVYPVYAYHVNRIHYEKAAEAGINIVQMGAFDTAAAAIEALDAAKEAGIMGLVCLYHDMRPAGDDINIEKTIRIVDAIKDHPALFGYGVMDEVFARIPNAEPLLEASYRLIRSVDDKHPVTTMEALKNYYAKAAKYVDVLCIDPYSSAEQKNAMKGTETALEAVQGEKPIYALLWAYYDGKAYPTYNDGRNNNWQALMSGAAAVGYYSVSDSDTDDSTGEKRPIWEARDGGAFWNGLTAFAEKEKKISFDRFVFKKYNSFAEKKTDTYWYSAWHTDTETYAIVLGFKKAGEQNISIPIEGAFRAELIAGRAAEEFSGVDQLPVCLSGTEALLYRITPITASGNIQNSEGNLISVIPPGEAVTVFYRTPVIEQSELKIICAVYEESNGIKELIEIYFAQPKNAGVYSGFWIAEGSFKLCGGTKERMVGLFAWDSVSALSPMQEAVFPMKD